MLFNICDFPNEILEKSETIKNLLIDFPDQQTINLNLTLPSDLNLNLVIDIYLNNKPTSDIILIFSAMIFADYLGLPPFIPDYKKSESMIEDIKSLTKFPDFYKHVLRLLQNIDLKEIENHPALINLIKELGFLDSHSFFKTNKYRSFFIGKQERRIEVLINENREWTGTQFGNFYYLDPKGKLIKLDNSDLSDLNIYRKLFCVKNNGLILETENGDIVKIDSKGQQKILETNISLKHVVTDNNDNIILVGWHKFGYNVFYLLKRDNLVCLNVSQTLENSTILSISSYDDGVIIKSIQHGFEKVHFYVKTFNQLVCINKDIYNIKQVKIIQISDKKTYILNEAGELFKQYDGDRKKQIYKDKYVTDISFLSGPIIITL